MKYSFICLVVLVLVLGSFMPSFAQDQTGKRKPCLQLPDPTVHMLLDKTDCLLSEFVRSLTPEQLEKAKPKAAWYGESCSTDPDLGGLGFWEVNTDQFIKLVMACKNLRTVEASTDIQLLNDYRIWIWRDVATGELRGELRMSANSGRLLGLRSFDPKRADEICASIAEMTQTLWQSLTVEQKKQAAQGLDPGNFKADSLPYNSLSMDQRELFLAIMDAEIIFSGAGRSHLTGDTSTWMIAYDEKDGMVWLVLTCTGYGFKIQS